MTQTMDNRLTWGTWVAQRRMLLDFTQHELAQAVGCSKSLIFKLERSIQRPSVSVASLIAQQLHIHPVYHEQFIQAGRDTYLSIDLPPPEYAHIWTEAVSRLPFAPPPITLNRLQGRSTELAQLRELLTQPTTRCLTLTGPGGVGKTHLAQELAEQLARHFPDGIVWIDLTRIRSATLLPLLLVHVLQLPQTHPDDIWQQIHQILTQRRCMLVLDNAEHLLPELATRLKELLELHPLLKVLSTSRSALDLAQENVVAIQPLDVGQLTQALPTEHMVAHPAVALFLERMQQRGSSGDTSPTTLQAIASICHMLDGLPLAIELAAARTRVLPPVVLRDQLTSQLLHLLQQRSSARPERQQTLYQTIDWSYQLLPEAAQYLFLRLGFFISPVDSATLLAVCDQLNTCEQLEQQIDLLVEAHLVLRTAHADGVTSYTMLETVRAFAYERIKHTPVYAAMLLAYSRYIYETITTAVHDVHNHGAPTDHWATFIEQQHSQLQRTFAELVQHHTPEAVELFNSLSFFWEIFGYWHVIVHWATRLTRNIELGPQEQVQVQHTYSRALIYLGQRDQAAHILEQALALAQDHHFEHLYVRLLHTLGYTYLSLKRLSEAKTCFQAHHTRVTQHNNPPGLIHSLTNLAHVERACGSYSTAIDLYHHALAIARQHQHQLHLCTCLTSLAETLIDTNAIATALPLLTEAHQLAEQLKYRGAQEFILVLRGRAAVLQDQPDQARSSLQEALTMAQELGNKSNICEVLEALAFVAAKTQHLQQAAHLLGAASALRQQWNTPQIYTNVILDHLTHCLEQHTIPALRMQWQAQGAILTLDAIFALALSI